MLTIRSVAGMLAMGLMLFETGETWAQTYPNKPVRLFASIGGGGDFAARLIAQELAPGLGQQVIVDSRGGGVIAGELVAKAAPDGYTLLYYGNTLWLLPLMRDHVRYDPLKDFAPVTLTVRGTTVLVIHPSLPVKSVKELIALAKARPGELNYASAAAGSSGHLSAELLKYMTGIDIMRITYKGSGPALNALLGGEVHMAFPSLSSAASHIKSGKLRALAVTSSEPTPQAPGLPTVAAAGLPGFETSAFYGVFAPAGTPAALINRLHQEIVSVLNKPDVKERFISLGVEVIGGPPEQLAAAMKGEMLRMGKVIKAAGIRDQ